MWEDMVTEVEGEEKTDDIVTRKMLEVVVSGKVGKERRQRKM